jgi:hypothetical protein
MTTSSSPFIRSYCRDGLDAVIDVYRAAIRQAVSRDYDAGQIAAWAQVDRDIWTAHRQHHGAPLFQREGFKVIAAQTVESGGQSFTNFRMEKHLPRPNGA